MVAVVSEVLGEHYTHTKLNTIFGANGAPGAPPVGNKIDKCRSWLTQANILPDVDALAVLGGVLEAFLEVEIHDDDPRREDWRQQRDRVQAALAKAGLSYANGGQIFRGTVGAPTRSLENVLRARDFQGVEAEFKRASDSVEADPAAAVTAACTVVEALCKIYIQDEKLSLPSKQDVKGLWHVVREHLKLDPKLMPDQDLATILGGLAAIVNGIGALRTHAGSAHGQGRTTYRLQGRHARLAVHSAHTLVLFLIETWDVRRQRRPP